MKILCRSRDEMKIVLKILDDKTNVRWRTGDKPLGFFPFEEIQMVELEIERQNRMSYRRISEEDFTERLSGENTYSVNSFIEVLHSMQKGADGKYVIN